MSFKEFLNEYESNSIEVYSGGGHIILSVSEKQKEYHIALDQNKGKKLIRLLKSKKSSSEDGEDNNSISLKFKDSSCIVCITDNDTNGNVKIQLDTDQIKELINRLK